jgi:hypothetical protein
VFASRNVTVDATPPVTTILPSVPSMTDNPAGPLQTPAANITFDFSAQDASNVTFQCTARQKDGPDAGYVK